jgi:hypothetical protein
MNNRSTLRGNDWSGSGLDSESGVNLFPVWFQSNQINHLSSQFLCSVPNSGHAFQPSKSNLANTVSVGLSCSANFQDKGSVQGGSENFGNFGKCEVELTSSRPPTSFQATQPGMGIKCSLFPSSRRIRT